MQLPGVTGFEVCRRLKADERTRPIPVIFMTALTGVEDKVKGFEVGGVDYISKPFQHEEFLARVTTHLRLRDLTQALEEANKGLELHVAKRTAELTRANARLEEEIAERKQAEVALQQLNRELRAISYCNQVLVRAQDEQTLLNDICRIICDEAGYRLAWVGYVEHDEAKTVRPAAWGGHDGEYVVNAKLSWADDAERAQGPGGTAIRSGEIIYIQDFTTDPLMAPWRESALSRGYRSVIGLPLKDEKANVFGVLLIYSMEVNSFTPDELRLLEELASDLAFGIGVLRTRAERKRVEEEIKNAQKLSESIIRNSPVGILSTGMDGTITGVNSAALKILGSPSEEKTKQFNVLTMDNMVKQGISEFFARCLKKGETIIDESIEYISIWGKRLCISISIVPLMTSDNKQIGAITMLNDITERKQAEEALRESEVRYRTLFAHAPDAIFLENEDDEILDVNPAACVLLGYSREELLAMQVSDLQASELRGQLGNVIKNELSRHGSIPFESVNLRRDGTRVAVEISDALIGDSGLALSIVRDITERKRAEEELRAAHQQLATIIDFLPDATFVIDRDKKVIAWNRAIEEMTGTRKGDILGQGNYAYAIPWYGERRPILIDLIEADDPEFRSKYEYVHKHGNMLFAEVFVPSVFGGRGADLWVTASPLLDSEGKQVGAIESVRDITERKQAEKIRETLYEISQAAISADKLEDLYQSIHDILGGLMTVENFFIALYDPSSDLLSYPYFVDQFDAVPAPGKPGRGLTGYVLRTGCALLASPEVFDAMVERGEVEAVGSPSIDWVGVPLRVENHIIGVMAVQSYTERVRYGKKEMDIMEFVSTQVAMAIERKRSFEEIQRHLQRLNALRTIDMALTSGFDLRLNLGVLLEQVLTQLAVDAADVLLLNPYTLTLEYAAGRGFRTRAVENARIRLGESFAGRAALEHRAVRLDNPAQTQEIPQFAALWNGEGFAAYYAVPLVAKGQVKGVLEVFHRAPLAAERDWVSFLEALAGQAAIAIENAQLFDHLQRSNLDLVLAYDATIEGWARALDLRDKETEGHTQRVTVLTERLARAMGISEAEIVHIRRGALLHDIGKMGVPDSILLKPDKLTHEEWVIMSQHPQYALDMLVPITFLRPALDIPYRHHEKWDGSGYPHGLKGEQIPLAARVFAVIDVWDALNSDRPYRKAWSRAEMLEYIRSQAGAHFDPKIVDAFLALVLVEEEE